MHPGGEHHLTMRKRLLSTVVWVFIILGNSLASFWAGRMCGSSSRSIHRESREKIVVRHWGRTVGTVYRTEPLYFALDCILYGDLETARYNVYLVEPGHPEGRPQRTLRDIEGNI